MKIGIQTWGSNGDIRPMIALADGLRKAGHTVTLIVSSIDNRSYSDLCRNLNIAYRQIPERFNFDIEDFAQRSFKMNPLQWLNALLDAAFLPYEQQIYQAARQLADENDAVIGHHFLYPLKMAARKTSIPHISVTLCHAPIPTLQKAPFRFPNLGPLLNRWQWRLFDTIFDLALKDRLGKLWLAEGMPRINHVLPDLLASDWLNLVAVDPLFFPFRPQRPNVHQVTGFLKLPEDADTWDMPETLRDFLASGERPVYMTFGSLQQAAPEWSMELFVAVANRAGCRAIIQTSSERFPEHSRQGDCYFIGRHPHLPLFKHCAAVVHHGGAGTTQTATLAGLPSVVVPFIDEQLFWGRQLQQLGLAPKPLPAKRIREKKLADSLLSVLNDAGIRERAGRAGEKLQHTDGVNNAVRLIEETIKSCRTT